MSQKLTPKNKTYKGFKATDKNMCCNGFQFEIGKWYTHKGEIVLCQSGFHFCEYSSGPWAYYSECRLFAVEAKEVLLSEGPGADLKHVAKKIRLVEEISVDGNWNIGDGNTGHRNAGNRNTGNRNTGDWNTGHRNAGNWNTGHRNAGYWNTGDGNTGDRNTGDWNTGDWNTGHRNAGDRNTGDWNTGHRNTGNRNTGDGNTGDGNCGDYHSGCLCSGDAPFFIFNKPANRKDIDFGLVNRLSFLMQKDDPIDPNQFLGLPNATVESIAELHKAHIEARKKLKK